MDKYIKTKKCYREAGVSVLRVNISLPEAAGEIGKFYDRLMARYLSFAEKNIAPSAGREFLLSDDEKKRFTFKPYIYTVASQTREADGILTVIRRHTLSRRGADILEFSYEDAFDIKTGLLIKRGPMKMSRTRVRQARKRR